MYSGKTLSQLAQEVERQTQSKRDFKVESPALRMELKEINNVPAPVLSFANGQREEFGIRSLAHEQIGQRLAIPKAYYDRMLESSPALLAGNVNHWLSTDPKKFMLRVLDEHVRAVVSNRYRRLDYADMLEELLPMIGEAGAEIQSCELTERRLYLKCVFPKIEREVKRGDVVQAGVVISNSEVGLGSVKVEPLIYRLICLNGAISSDYGLRKYHVGRGGEDFDGAAELFEDETMKADDKAFWLKTRDVVKATLDDTKFRTIVNKWAEATKIEITRDPVKVVEDITKKFTLRESEQGNVLTHLIQGGDLSQYGLMNAITRASQDVDNYERATELERVGPMVLELSKSDWKEIAEK